MPQTGQERDLPRFRSLPCAVYLRAFEMPAGHRVEMHDHPWGQLMYAASGTLRASTERHSYLVPAQRALWIPPGVRHAAEACNPVLFRSLYLDRSLPGGCRVLEVSGLLRELLLRAAEFPREYPPGGEAERLMQVVADEVGRLREAPLNLPLPGDPRLRRITDALQADPADPRGISDWAGLVGASRRTLARLFREQTQLSFREWRQRLRLLNAVAALEEGASVTRVASDLGYDSTSAFISLFQRHFGQTPGCFARSLRLPK
ncbi:helix-turn-helix transcriptional regulator [Pseudomonas aeruginosa]|uniref:AraC family transcriptional regulator n=1 Tax=Pseudomonas aeruginosa TaxID=287 RepID=UPI000406E7E2|nr:helix-turn-helix transcriptional regulator [Pseudomonas aeruginosa]MBG7529025.1 helix-turn-helix transcriptional regulator [Pseudomonas aeruginosa]MBH4089987.1 helix-turn-helix transcriptional regulator [Pseudomonas aeruginosa]MBH8842082.1 helix-turn-helix transcriptional regulator [Pseudomonas aeruginosa]MBI8985208.1 helix-turn-helix transcriptional regulator [Pseudomonas aeruginosa]MDN3868717.1 helix-turn-helix transcriptional regulator [Pseudomonas aeruginosa]